MLNLDFEKLLSNFWMSLLAKYLYKVNFKPL